MKKLLLILPIIALAGCQTTQQPAQVLLPVENCGMFQVPVYGILDRPSSDGEILGGAVVGGVIGNQFGKGDGNTAMTILGAIDGRSAVANDRKEERVIVRYESRYECRTEYMPHYTGERKK